MHTTGSYNETGSSPPSIAFILIRKWIFLRNNEMKLKNVFEGNEAYILMIVPVHCCISRLCTLRRQKLDTKNEKQSPGPPAKEQAVHINNWSSLVFLATLCMTLDNVLVVVHMHSFVQCTGCSAGHGKTIINGRMSHSTVEIRLHRVAQQLNLLRSKFFMKCKSFIRHKSHNIETTN